MLVKRLGLESVCLDLNSYDSAKCLMMLVVFFTRDRIIVNKQLQLRAMSALIELITRFSETTGGVCSLILEI